jgi:hypothetical protein
VLTSVYTSCDPRAPHWCQLCALSRAPTTARFQVLRASWLACGHGTPSLTDDDVWFQLVATHCKSRGSAAQAACSATVECPNIAIVISAELGRVSLAQRTSVNGWLMPSDNGTVLSIDAHDGWTASLDRDSEGHTFRCVYTSDQIGVCDGGHRCDQPLFSGFPEGQSILNALPMVD